jgi:hypothetical protein
MRVVCNRVIGVVCDAVSCMAVRLSVRGYQLIALETPDSQRNTGGLLSYYVYLSPLRCMFSSLYYCALRFLRFLLYCVVRMKRISYWPKACPRPLIHPPSAAVPKLTQAVTALRRPVHCCARRRGCV